MRLRNPLSVAVIGALLLGGAVTGTTRASWVSQVNLHTQTVGSGAMGIAASAAGGLTLERGGQASVMVTVNDTSSTAAKNLRQRVTPTVTGSLPSGVTAALTTSNGSSCTGTAQGPVDLTPGGSFTTCLTVAATSGSAASAATVTLGISGAQVRGGTVAGWTTPTQTVSVPVTVQGFRSPVLTCPPGALGNGSFRYSWQPVPDAVYYGSQESGNNSNWGWPSNTGGATNETVYLSQNETLFVRVLAIGPGFELALSNVLRLHRNGSSSNITCEDLG